MLSKAPSKHSEEKGGQALFPTGVSAILDVASNFTRQFSPQSRSWLPLTKELLKESPPTYSQRTAAFRSLKHGEELETFRGAFGIAYTSASVCPGGVSVAASLVTGLGQARASKAPARPGGAAPTPAPIPCAVGGDDGPAAGGQRRRAEGHGRSPLPGGARHVQQPKGKGVGLCRGAAGPSPTPFLPPASRGAAPEPLPSGPARLRSPLSACGGQCFGTPRPAPRLPRETPREQRLMPLRRPAGTAGCGRRQSPIARLRLQTRAAHRRRPCPRPGDTPNRRG